jgi:hypothetical protein
VVARDSAKPADLRCTHVIDFLAVAVSLAKDGQDDVDLLERERELQDRVEKLVRNANVAVFDLRASAAPSIIHADYPCGCGTHEHRLPRQAALNVLENSCMISLVSSSPAERLPAR